MMTEMTAANTPDRPSRTDWQARMGAIGEMHGFFERLGRDHFALYVQEGDTLLVSFDEVDRVIGKGADALPAGFEAVKKREWSMLSILADGRTWFRDAGLYRFFDKLTDEGFFDSFDQVIFLGAGPMCGYAAAAFSVAAPGAKVLVLSPAATLDRASAPFELRFRAAWRKDFNSRYGYAPDMIDSAAQTFVIYDPLEVLDAAHAALFRAPTCRRLRFRGAGAAILSLLEPHSNLDRVLKATANNRLSELRFSQITRRLRQGNRAYLERLLARAEDRGGARLAAIVARRGLSATGAAHFARRLSALEAQIARMPRDTAVAVAGE